MRLAKDGFILDVYYSINRKNEEAPKFIIDVDVDIRQHEFERPESHRYTYKVNKLPRSKRPDEDVRLWLLENSGVIKDAVNNSIITFNLELLGM